MKIFRIEKLKFAPVIVIADDAKHATHFLFQRVYDGFGFYPKMERTLT